MTKPAPYMGWSGRGLPDKWRIPWQRGESGESLGGLRDPWWARWVGERLAPRPRSDFRGADLGVWGGLRRNYGMFTPWHASASSGMSFSPVRLTPILPVGSANRVAQVAASSGRTCPARGRRGETSRGQRRGAPLVMTSGRSCITTSGSWCSAAADTDGRARKLIQSTSSRGELDASAGGRVDRVSEELLQRHA